MTIVEEFRDDSARVLDRLVDGELGPQERRQLLACFDDEPGAWRSCALAFLESQSWRWQLTRVASEPILAQVTQADRKPVGTTRLGWMPWLAVAASLLVAFALGTQLRRGPLVGTSEPLVTQRDAVHPEPQQELAANDRGNNNRGNEATAPDLASPTSAQPESSDFPRTLTLKPLDGDEDRTIELPIVDSDALLADNDDAALSQSLLQQFERDGFRVKRQQRYWPVELPDGRQVVVPVEEVSIRAPEVEHL